MMKRFGLLLVAGLLLSWNASALRADDEAAPTTQPTTGETQPEKKAEPAAEVPKEIKEIETKVVEAWKKHKTVAFKLMLTSEREQGGVTMKMRGDGTFKFKRDGDKERSRTEMTTKITGMMDMEQKMLNIVDGDVTYMLIEAMGQKMAMKDKTRPEMSQDPAQMFARWYKDYTVKLLPEQKVNDKEAWVIEATPKENPQNVKELYYIVKDDAFMVKMEALDAEGKPTLTQIVQDVKFDVEIDPKEFEFVLPEGVTLQDRTQGGGPSPTPGM